MCERFFFSTFVASLHPTDAALLEEEVLQQPESKR